MGLVPVLYGLIRLCFFIRPRWKHVIVAEKSCLKVGRQSYEWKQFNSILLERKESGRSIHLVGDDGKLDVVIRDNLPGFDDLAQECFSCMSRKGW